MTLRDASFSTAGIGLACYTGLTVNFFNSPSFEVGHAAATRPMQQIP